MSSNLGGRRGQQEPRFAVDPPHVSTDGNDAAELAASYGLPPDPWQRDVLCSWLGRNTADKYTATSCGLAVPRQNGKNGVLEMRELYGMCVIGERFLHSAHEVKTARKAFLRLCSFFENARRYPELAEMVVSIRKTNGQEAIELKNGASVEFTARSRGAARGFTVDVVVFDEAQELTDEQIEAMIPTLAAAPLGNRQFIYTGTPPSPGSPGEVFRRTRESALSGTDKTLSWFEWSVEDIGDITDRNRWYETNPALGIRLDEGFCEKELSALSEDGFARERLGWWSGQRAAAAISTAIWENSGTLVPPKEGLKCFGVKFAPDGSQVALAACRRPDEGVTHAELLACHPMSDGITWLSDWLCDETRAEETAAIAIDGKNGAAALIDKLAEAYPRQALMTPGARGASDAANMCLEALRAGDLTHFKNPGQAILDESASESVRRPIGQEGAWGFGGEHSAPLEAFALAFWAAKTTKRDPEGGCVIL